QRRATDAEQPTCGGNNPKKNSAAGSLRGFLPAQANAHLRASGKITRHGHRHVAKRAEQFARARRFAGAAGAFKEMLLQPGLVRGGESFDQRLRQKSLGSVVEVFTHATPSGKPDFSASRPR